MQLFNGLSMRNFNLFNVRFDPESGNQEKVAYDMELPKVQNNINLLKNDIQSDDEQAKSELDSSLTDNFLSGINEYLAGGENSVKSALEQSIREVLQKNITLDGYETKFKSLIKLANVLGIKGYSTKEEYFRNLDIALGINGDISDENLTKLSVNQSTEGKFYNDGKKVDTPPQWVDGVCGSINGQIDRLRILLGENSEFKDNEGLKKANKLLNNIQEIIKNPIESNVQVLQQYVFDNLDTDKEKNDFKTNNKYKESTKKFDGKFGDSTKIGLEKVLNKTDNYIKSVSSSQNTFESGAVDAFKDVKVKKEIDLPNGNIEASSLLEPLPLGVKANFKEGSSVDRAKVGDQEVTIVLKSGDKEQQILLIVQVENGKLKISKKDGNVDNENGGEAPIQQVDATPLTLGGNEFQVVNSQTMQNLPSIPGAMFYSAVLPGNPEAASQQSPEIAENGERVFYLKFNNGDIFKVRVDNAGNLCPVATKIDSDITGKGGRNLETETLLKNNGSCISYLQNKIPESIKSGCEISWNNNVQDYVLTSYGRTLTIEPMTIATSKESRNWISDDLGKNLAFLNLTNFIRYQGDKHEKRDPDIKFNGDKLRINGVGDVTDFKGKFGLEAVTDEELSRFKKYNNREQWEDDWDVKKPNRNYDKVDFPNIRMEGQGSEHSQQGATQLNAGDNLSARTVRRQNDVNGGYISEVVVTGSVLRPKKPIFSVENDGEEESKIGGLEGIGAFDGSGNFKLDENIKEKSEGDKTTINVGNDIFTKINYTEGDGMSIQEFSGKGYQIGDSGEMKWFFIGEYDKENKAGKGKRVFENGAIYDGEWKDCKENGQGKYIYPNGDVYEGNFENGKFNGEGIYTWKNGVKYVGEFVDDKMTKGTIILTSTGGETMSFKVESDAKGLKITDGDNVGKYIDVESGSIKVVASVDDQSTQGNLDVAQQNVSDNNVKNVKQPSKSVENRDLDPEKVTQYGLRWNALSSNKNKKAYLGIPSGKFVYTHGNTQRPFIYKVDNSTFYGVNEGSPYEKTKIIFGKDSSGKTTFRTNGKELNVCQAGVDKLNAILRSNRNAGLTSVKMEGEKYYGIVVQGGGYRKELNLDDISKILKNEDLFTRTHKYSDGEYTGELNNGKMEGKGTFKRNNGDSYDGTRKDGKMEGKGTFKGDGGIQYEGEWSNGKIIKCTSYGNSLSINYDSQGGFIQAKNGIRLRISNPFFLTSNRIPYGKLANTINKIVNIVKYARSSSGEHFKLDQFEEDGGKVQADYEKYVRDTDLLSADAVKNSTGVDAKTLVNWLNNYRSDVGI